jgi:hypothetical protein
MSNKRRRRWWKNPTWYLVIFALIGIVVTIILRPWAPPDFSISGSPMKGQAQTGGVIQTTITVEGIHQYKHEVNLTTSGHPSDIVVTFVPESGKAIPKFVSTMTMTLGSNVPTGDYTIAIQGTGADGIKKTCEYLLTVKPNSTPPPTPECEIKSPKEGDKLPLGTQYLVEGTVSNKPDNSELWLITTAEDEPYYPQRRVITNVSTGNWSGDIYTGICDYANMEFHIYAVFADEQADRELQGYIDDAIASNNYTGLTLLPSGTVICAEITVVGGRCEENEN